jgi:hypothetical protein
MEYANSLKALRAQMLAKTTGMQAPEKQGLESFISSRAEKEQPQESTGDLLARSAGWLSEIKDAASSFARMYNASTPDTVRSGRVGASESFMQGFVQASRKNKEAKEEAERKEKEAEVLKEAFIARRSESSPSTYGPERPEEREARIRNASEITSFKDAIDLTEGGGDYDTLFGFSNRDGKPFAGTRISNMTIGEIKQFAAPRGKYGQWVKGQVGRVATPMGRYQFVGSTLKALAGEMGLSDDTVFSPEVQDAMFEFYLDKRIRSGRTMDEKVSQVREAWEGFKSVPRSTLETLIMQREAT